MVKYLYFWHVHLLDDETLLSANLNKKKELKQAK